MIVFSFLLILFGAMVYCVLVPDVYKSSTKIAHHSPNRVGGDGPHYPGNQHP